jgi:hypothetical protein
MPIAITFACYGPTEVTVVITTDLSCSENPRTAIFKGLPFESAPDAETDSCTTAPNADATIGSLVFLPSGDDNGRAGVKAVLARRRSVAECDAHPEDCIVATRSFSFVKHLSRRVPVRMLAECLGKRCPEGQTCGAGGTCVSNEVDCTTNDCQLPGDSGVDASLPSNDGGIDADAALPPACAGPLGNGILAQMPGSMPGPLQAAFGDGVFYYFERKSNFASSIMSVTTSGGQPSEIFPLPGPDGTLIALTTLGPNWIAAHDRTVGPTVPASISFKAGSVDMGNNDANAVMSIAAALDMGSPAVYVARASNVEKVLTVSGAEVGRKTFYAKHGGHHVEVDSSAVYLASAAGIEAIDRSTGELARTIPLVPDSFSGRVVFGKNGDKVYAAGMDNGTAKIFAMKGVSAAPEEIIVSPAPVVSLAADPTHIYWTDGRVVLRTSRLSVGPKRSVEVVRAAVLDERIDHLAVTADCLYFWSQPPGVVASGVLRVAPKSLTPSKP